MIGAEFKNEAMVMPVRTQSGKHVLLGVNKKDLLFAAQRGVAALRSAYPSGVSSQPVQGGAGTSLGRSARSRTAPPVLPSPAPPPRIHKRCISDISRLLPLLK